MRQHVFFKTISLLLALALSWAVQIACLWYAGFFQALPGIGAEQLVSYYYWAMNGIVPNALILLVTIPVKMWLLPYQGVTRAGFYDARLQALLIADLFLAIDMQLLVVFR